MDPWTRMHRVVDRVAAALCRHPAFIVCEHRSYAHDFRYAGYLAGFQAGRANMEAKWRGSITGVGPYAGYPPPSGESPRSREDAP